MWLHVEVGPLNELVRVELWFLIGDALIKETAGTGIENRPCQTSEKAAGACVEEKQTANSDAEQSNSCSWSCSEFAVSL